MTRRDLLLLFLLGLAVRVPLLAAYPGVYGDDSVTRLAYSDQLVLAYQLPLPQLVVAVTRALAPGPFWTKLAFSAIGATLGVALALVVARLETPWAARIAGVLASTHPVLVYYSMVPYQEAAMLALLLAGAAALLDDRRTLAGLFIGLACLCRYEAWIAAALIIARQRSIRSALLFGGAPLAWVLLWRGLSPQGTYVLDLDLAAGHLRRLPYLADKLSDYGGQMATIAAVAGAVWILRRGDPRWRWGALYCGALLAVLVAFAHEHPAGSGRVSERLVHVPAIAACASLGVLVARLGRETSAARGGLAIAVVATVALLDLDRVRSILDEAHRSPDLQLARAAAAAIERELGTRAHVAVAAPGVPAAALAAYIHKVEQAGGDTGRARVAAERYSRLTPDGVRLAAHLGRPPGTVVPFGTPAAIVAVFDDAVGPGTTPFARLTAGDRRAALFRGAPDAGGVDSGTTAD